MRRLRTFEALEERQLLWASAYEHEGTGYFLAADQPALQRYELATHTWLDSLPLAGATGTATAAAFTDDAIFVAFGSRVERFATDGTERVELVSSAPASIRAIYVDDVADTQLVFAYDSGGFSAFNTATSSLWNVRTAETLKLRYTSHDPVFNRVVGRGTAYPPIQRSQVYNAGQWIESTVYYEATTGVDTDTWLFPNASRVIGSDGRVTDAFSGQLLASLGSQIDDLAFAGDSIVTRFGTTVTLFDVNTLMPMGVIKTSVSATSMLADDASVTLFHADPASATGFRAESHDFSEFTMESGPSVDPVELVYTPDQILPTAAGELLILSKSNQSLFLWNLESQQYLASIKLTDTPDNVIYAPTNNSVYVAYSSGLVTQIDLDDAEPREVSRMIWKYGAAHLSFANDYLVLHNPLSLLDLDLQVIATGTANVSNLATWNETNERFYYMSNDDLLSVSMNAGGGQYESLPLGGIGTTLYARSTTGVSYAGPFRISPDGELAVMASGHLIDAKTMVRDARVLPKPIVDSAWLGSDLYTIRNRGTLAEIQRWNADLTQAEVSNYRLGTARSLFAIGSNRLVSLTLDSAGIPRFTVFDENLTILPSIGTFVVVESDGTTAVSEDGATDTLEVTLARQPASDVVISVAPLDSQVDVSQTQLTFTPQNWQLPQVLQVSAIEDSTTDLDPTSFVVLAVDEAQSDPSFHGDAHYIVTTLVEDNDTTVLAKIEHGGIHYTFASNHNRVTRFDLATQTWLAPIVLVGAEGMPSTAAVNDDGIYLSYGPSVYRYEFDGTGRELAMQVSLSVVSMKNDGELLFVGYYDSSKGYVTSYDTQREQIIATYSRTRFVPTWMTIDREARRLLARTSSNYLASLGYQPDGSLVDYAEISSTANGQQFPQGWRRIDSFSRIVSTTTLETLGFLPTGTTSNVYSLYFLESGHILALHWGKLNLYDANLTRVGSLTVDYSLKEMMLDGSNILLRDNYYPDGPWTLTVPLSQLMPAEDPPPESIAYDPKGVIATADGTVYLNAKLLTQVLRWNSSTQAFESPIQLRGVAEAVSYSAAQNALFVAYGNGDITRIDLNGDEPLEVPFAAAGNRVVGMSVAGDYLFVATYSTRMTFSPEGVLVESIPAGGDPVEYLWSDASQSVYYRLVTTSAAVQIKIHADGTIPGEPPGGIASVDSIGDSNFGAPVEVSPDGQQLLFAGGLLVDTAYPQFAPQRLANAVTDGAWLGEELFTIRAFDTFSELQRWTGPTHLQTRSLQIPGKPYAIKALPDERLLIISIDGQGVPLLRVFDRDFHEIQRQVGLLIDQTAGSTQVNESGTTDTIGLSLSAPPLGPVTITITSWDTGEATVSPAALVFTSENWNVPQMVTVTGVDDTLVDRTQSAILQFTSDSAAVPTRYVTATIVDNEQVSLPLVQLAGIAYFFMTNESRVERFEIASETWLPPIQLEGIAGVPTAAIVDELALYVAYGSTLLRYELDGTQPTVLVTTANQIQSLYVDSDLIFVVQTSSPKLESYDKHQGTRLATSSQYLAVTAIDPVNNRLYGVSSGYLRYIDYDDAGTFSGLKSLSSTANRLWVSPDGVKLFASNGSIHVGLDLQGYAAIPGNIADMAFLGNDVPIVLRSNQLATYNNALAQTGTLTFNHVPSRILLNEVHVITLTLDMTSPSGFLIRTIPLALLNPATPQAPLDPHGAPIAPDDVETTSDGTLLLLSKLHNAIFRWLPATQTFGATIPLAGEVDAITYFAPTNSIFVAYESKQLVRIDLDDPQLAEHPVVVLPNRLYGLGVAGEYLITAPGPNTYRTDGTLVDTSRYEQTGNDATWRARRGEFVWNEFQQRVFYAVGTSMMSTEINANGVSYPTEPPGGVGNTRAFSGTYYGTTGFVRLSPDEKTAILGSGYVIDLSGEYFTTIAGRLAYFKDAAWIGNRPYTLRVENGYSIVEERATTDYTVIRSWQVNSATPHSLRAIEGGRLLLITLGADLVPVFSVLDAELQSIAVPPATIVGRQIFYNNSKFDHDTPGVDGDDAAIATDKRAYLPDDGPSEFASVSSYAHGINGLMIDLAGPRGLVSVDDFTFHVGLGGDPNGWSTAPAPSSFTVRLGAGVDGSDRIEITWPDGAIRNTWLRVQIRANVETGLAEKFPGVFGSPGYGDVFYFGNKVGDTGEGDAVAFITSAADEVFTRAGVGFNRPITELRDFNRDGVVSAADFILSRTNTASPILQRLNVPAPEAVAANWFASVWAAAEPAGTRSDSDLTQVATALALLAIEDSAPGSDAAGLRRSLVAGGLASVPASATIDRCCLAPAFGADVDDFFANLTLADEELALRSDELSAESAELPALRI